MHLYFIRHGQSVNNAGWGDPDYKESPDPVLTDPGIEQAQLVANFLEAHQQVTEPDSWNVQNEYGFGITHLYASLMERAVHTASYTARKLNVPFQAWDIHESGGIFERDYAHGQRHLSQLKGLPGNPRSFYEKNFPEFKLPDSLDGTGWWNRPFESEEDCQVRADRIWAELLARHGDKKGQPDHRVAFVSHGGFFTHLMCAILDLPWRQASQGLKSWFLLNNCSISRIDVTNEHVTVCYLNRTSHLPSHLIT